MFVPLRFSPTANATRGETCYTHKHSKTKNKKLPYNNTPLITNYTTIQSHNWGLCPLSAPCDAPHGPAKWRAVVAVADPVRWDISAFSIVQEWEKVKSCRHFCHSPHAWGYCLAWVCLRCAPTPSALFASLTWRPSSSWRNDTPYRFCFEETLRRPLHGGIAAEGFGCLLAVCLASQVCPQAQN